MRTSRIASVCRVAALALTVGVGGSLAGCYTSQDKFTYDSRTWSPKTVVLVDTRTGEELWRYEVPVGAELELKFASGDEDNLRFPDEMRWHVRSTIGTSLNESDVIPSPPEEVRRVDWYLRDAPEYPRPDAPPATPRPLEEPAETGEATSAG